MAGEDKRRGDAERLLGGIGLRPTWQRVRVLAELMRERDDVTAQELHERLRARGERLGLATVYRTLSLLEEIGVLSHAHLESGAEYHRAEDAGHVHLACSRCGAEDDLSIDEAQALERLIRRHHGFAPDLTHFAISGLCATCFASRR